MSKEVRALEPLSMWNHFADLNAVPRPSKKEERVIEFMRNFGEGLGLLTMVDEIGNVIIKKPASPGMEDRQTIVMQSHLDMVHQKNNDTDFDFDNQGIEMFVEEDWVKAKGTTLGADNGIGVASIMAILASTDIAHPAVEALFTIDEETGMTGAMGLKGGLLDGTIMLNLDTEDDDELTIGCAGGVDITAIGTYEEINTPNGKSFSISVKGLTGGHSGMDIIKGRGNANKLMNRLLTVATEKFNIAVAKIDGGGLRNAIPRESVAGIVISPEHESDFKSFIQEQEKIFQAERSTTDPGLVIEISEVENHANVLSPDFQSKLLKTFYACLDGIYRMSPDIEGLVQTSNNIARVEVSNGNFSVQCLTRSSVDSEKWDLAEAIKGCFELAGASVEFGGAYPGWTPKPDAAIVSIMKDLYRKMFDSEPHVMACHAGLECGILGTNYPKMEMISFGPNIRGAHSPDEKVQISSVHKYWKFLLETLGNTPKR